MGKTPIKRGVSRVKKVKKSISLKKTIKIVNPISGKKINLNGPTHKRLIREKVLDDKGNDIRTGSKKPQPKPKPKLYGDVMGSIMGFLPEKTMVEVSKYKKEYSNQNLLSYPFDLSDVERCQAFTDSDFDVLMKNQSLDRQSLFKCVVERGLIYKVKILLRDDRVDPGADDNHAIRVASRYGHLKMVRKLLKDSRVDPSALDNHAIQVASRNGHALVVRELLKDSRVDPSANNNKAIGWASWRNRLSVVKELLKDSRVNPASDYLGATASAIGAASLMGHYLVVKELLKDPKVDPSVGNDFSLIIASKGGHLKVVKLLLNDSRVNGANEEAFGLAVKYKHKEIVEILSQYHEDEENG